MDVSKIAVFDSGFGSLSIIKAIQKNTKAEIIYFADQKNFPYGKKSKQELEKIIRKTITNLKSKFNPDLIIVGSNTPSLLLNKIFSTDNSVMGVLPPLLEAQQLTKTNVVALLVTSSVAKSRSLDVFIKKNLTKKIKIIKIDSSELVELVESGKFIYAKKFCIEKIISVLQQCFTMYNVDVATLSSTHLPFLLPLLKNFFPNIKFLDPAEKVAKQIKNHKLFVPTKNSLKIFTTGNAKQFQTQLKKIGIEKSVHQIRF